jgi:hypothetical protein
MSDETTAAAPVTEAAAPTPASAATTETAPAPVSDLPDWAKDPAQALREVEKARTEAAAARTKAREAAKDEARATLLKELGLVNDDEPADPKQVAADLAAARTQATDAARELAIFRNAPTGTDVNALLDSRSFMTTVGSIDPTDTAALVAAIGQAITNTPRLKSGQAPASSGTDIPGGQAPVRTYTRAQLRDPAFYQANQADIDLALVEGRIN